jgi:hypothetical protein
VLDGLLASCQSRPTYLDRYYALQPGRPNGAKRLIVLLPLALRPHLEADWLAEIGAVATLVWRGGGAESVTKSELDAYEYLWVSCG